MTRIDNGTIQYRDELFRKSIHLFSLSIPIVYYFITTEAAALILGILAALALIIDLGRFPPGTYLAVFTNSKKKTSARGRFVVIK